MIGIVYLRQIMRQNLHSYGDNINIFASNKNSTNDGIF